MTLVASARPTGVEALQTEPFQWLKTIVCLSGCQVTRSQRSSPRTSSTATVRVLPSSTKLDYAPVPSPAQWVTQILAHTSEVTHRCHPGTVRLT